jgi:hypothetical protein
MAGMQHGWFRPETVADLQHFERLGWSTTGGSFEA